MGVSKRASMSALSMWMAKSGRKSLKTWFPSILTPRDAAPACLLVCQTNLNILNNSCAQTAPAWIHFGRASEE